MTVDAGTAEALVHLGETCGVMVTFGTHAGEAVGAVDTGAAVVARVDGTFVDVDVTHRPCNRRKEKKLVFHICVYNIYISNFSLCDRESRPCIHFWKQKQKNQKKSPLC